MKFMSYIVFFNFKSCLFKKKTPKTFILMLYAKKNSHFPDLKLLCIQQVVLVAITFNTFTAEKKGQC